MAKHAIRRVDRGSVLLPTEHAPANAQDVACDVRVYLVALCNLLVQRLYLRLAGNHASSAHCAAALSEPRWLAQREC